ncbi:hypothetical protein GPALN_006193 [Globodera pallida]|nr:hypothetical protein GPALN_006193 [Globodera pallida]
MRRTRKRTAKESPPPRASDECRTEQSDEMRLQQLHDGLTWPVEWFGTFPIRKVTAEDVAKRLDALLELDGSDEGGGEQPSSTRAAAQRRHGRRALLRISETAVEVAETDDAGQKQTPSLLLSHQLRKVCCAVCRVQTAQLAYITREQHSHYGHHVPGRKQCHAFRVGTPLHAQQIQTALADAFRQQQRNDDDVKMAVMPNGGDMPNCPIGGHHHHQDNANDGTMLMTWHPPADSGANSLSTLPPASFSSAVALPEVNGTRENVLLATPLKRGTPSPFSSQMRLSSSSLLQRIFGGGSATPKKQLSVAAACSPAKKMMTPSTTDGPVIDRVKTDPSSIGFETDRRPSSIGFKTDPSLIGFKTDPSSIGFETDRRPSSIGFKTDPSLIGFKTDPSSIGFETDRRPSSIGFKTDLSSIGFETDGVPSSIGFETDRHRSDSRRTDSNHSAVHRHTFTFFAYRLPFSKAALASDAFSFFNCVRNNAKMRRRSIAAKPSMACALTGNGRGSAGGKPQSEIIVKADEGEMSGQPHAVKVDEQLVYDDRIKEWIYPMDAGAVLEELQRLAYFCRPQEKEIVMGHLRAMPAGHFTLRLSGTRRRCLALSIRVEKDEKNPKGIAHYLVLRNEHGFRIKGSKRYFQSLPMLITHHSVMTDQLPCRLLLSDWRWTRDETHRRRQSSGGSTLAVLRAREEDNGNTTNMMPNTIRWRRDALSAMARTQNGHRTNSSTLMSSQSSTILSA